MTVLITTPQKVPLKGSITVPGDKSISHRAVMLAALASGQSQIQGWLPAGDTLATLEIIQSLGIDVRIVKRTAQSWDLSVLGQGLAGLGKPTGALDCKNAGTCMRLMAGILAGQQFSSTLDGSEQLRQRPMNRIIEPLSQMGAKIESAGGKAPLDFRPASLNGIAYELPIASAQIKSALLLAGLFADGDTSVRQPGPARDHTERMLANMGAFIEEDGQWLHLRRSGRERISIKPLNMEVPGDISSAAFPLVASITRPGSQITINHVGCNQTRTGILDALATMGAHIKYSNQIDSGGEPTAAITVKETKLTGCKLEGDRVVRAIDEIPIWAAAATQASGTSQLRDAAELRVKEVDRLHLLSIELRKMGAEISERPDGLDIHGPVRLKGTEVDSHGDHRLAMSLAVAGLIADSPTTVHSADCINDSFPGFVETMRSLGADLKWYG
jgi:3-phosphoshikimate 1-carboxyvinyltransferase